MADLVRFTNELHQTNNLARQMDLFVEVLQEFGYQQFLAGLIPAIAGIPNKKMIYVSNANKAWLEEYDSRGFAEYDVTVQHCLKHTDPLLWSDVIREEHAQTLDEDYRIVGERAAYYGYNLGVTIPMQFAFSPFRFGVSLIVHPAYADERLKAKTEAHDRLFHENRDTLFAFSHAFMSVISFRDEAIKVFNLTDQEVELMSSVVDGHKYDIIAKHMGIGRSQVHKVKYQISKIVEKFKVDNVDQARAIFSSLGLSNRPFNFFPDTLLPEHYETD